MLLTKNYQNSPWLSKQQLAKGGTFFETQCSSMYKCVMFRHSLTRYYTHYNSFTDSCRPNTYIN